jgi:hypothetical protein
MVLMVVRSERVNFKNFSHLPFFDGVRHTTMAAALERILEKKKQLTQSEERM